MGIAFFILRTFNLYVYALYCRTVRTTWNYIQKRPYKGNTLKESCRIYIHYYYNIDQDADDEKDFDRRLIALKQELESGESVPQHEKLYLQYFTVKTTPGCGTRVKVKEESVNEAKRYYGFFSLITNEKMDAVTALGLYFYGCNASSKCFFFRNGEYQSLILSNLLILIIIWILEKGWGFEYEGHKR